MALVARRVVTEWRDCEQCGFRAPFQNKKCLFCDASPGLTFDVDPAELQKKALEGRAAATGEMVKSGLKLWFISLFWRKD